jgi:DNA-binding transcriptional regulator YbjK
MDVAPRAVRARLIADTALALLAERGMRGLTHRAVDEAAGLPQGSTSNLARTRAALLEVAVVRLAEREGQAPAGAVAPPSDLDGLAVLLAQALHHAMTVGRDLTRARLELALEATRRPELRTAYDAAGAPFRRQLAALLTSLGSPDPARHTHSLSAWCEGILFASVAGPSSTTAPPVLAQLRLSARELLHGMLAPRD